MFPILPVCKSPDSHVVSPESRSVDVAMTDGNFKNCCQGSEKCDSIVQISSLNPLNVDEETAAVPVQENILTPDAMCMKIIEEESQIGTNEGQNEPQNISTVDLISSTLENITQSLQKVQPCSKDLENTVPVVDDQSDDSLQFLPSPSQNFDFSAYPFQITGAWKSFECVGQLNYTRGCKWSPDGSCILTNSEDNQLRLFNLPNILYQSEIDWNDVEEMRPALSVNENELVYDFCWYPHMSSQDSATCCFVSTARNSPIHMWDAFNGELRCSYRPYNHLDEIVAAHSVAFDPTGQYLFSGFNKMVRYFDVSIPGRKCEEIPTKYEKQGQSGIVSCFAFNPSNPTEFAAGSYSKTIGLYKYNRKKLLYLLEGQAGGVTHLKFSPDGTKLYSGARMDPEMLCWDLRNTKCILYSMLRMVTTNQRMYFDISRCGRYVVSGNNNGVVSVWDTSQSPKHTPGYVHAVLEPVQYFTAHGDCTNGVSLHPFLPLLATSSGQRLFPEIDDDSDEDSEKPYFDYSHKSPDNSLRLWWVGSSTVTQENSGDVVLN